MSPSLSELESRLGHIFGDKSLLERALLHNSMGRGDNYERLEFLGDRVLGICISDYLYTNFSDAQAGELSLRLARLVNNKVCALVADEIGLREFVNSNPRLTETGFDGILGDVIESIIAAIYLDGGLDSARDFVIRHWSDRLNDDVSDLRDPKTMLQEWAHSQGYGNPVYSVTKKSGPAHAPHFVITVTVDGAGEAEGEGNSKSVGEGAAARSLLESCGVKEE